MAFSYVTKVIYFPVTFSLISTAYAAFPTTLDGRIPKDAPKSLFTSSQSPFDTKSVLSQSKLSPS